MSTADLVIVDSGGANLASLQHALRRLGASSCVSHDAQEIAKARRVLLPGVGAAGDAMQRLRAAGLADCLRVLRQPLLGICLGMQLLYEDSEEGDAECLGLMPGRVTRLQPRAALPVPHMGWNRTQPQRDDALLAGLDDSSWFYFVHSYAAPADPATTLASADYGGAFAALVRRGNVCGAQFHPERSAASGARLLQNFLALPCT